MNNDKPRTSKEITYTTKYGNIRVVEVSEKDAPEEVRCILLLGGAVMSIEDVTQSR